MKQLINIFFIAALIVGLGSCKKDENQVVFEGGKAPVMTSNLTGSIPMSFATRDQNAMSLSWTNPEYKFNTGVSSQNVNYVIEIDTLNAGFTNPNKQTVSVGSNLNKTFTQAELNNYLLGMNLVTGIPHQVQMRVRASLPNNNARLFSNSITFTIIPFLIPPKIVKYTDDVFIVGSATPGDWGNPVPANQKLTKVSETVYTITMNLNGGGSYLFLPVNGSWNQKYGFDGANNTNDPESGDFVREGGDFRAPAAGGSYKIELNFQTGKYKLTRI
jgi:starch-binding outer membrane protein SusE/F